MDPSSITDANTLLREQGLRPRKRWGQNFLCDRNVLSRIVRAANLTEGEPVLEIGAGMGALTLTLADFSDSVTTVEIDPLMRPILDVTLAGKPIKVIYEDFLKLDLGSFCDEAFGLKTGVVVANVPYYITSPIIERLLEHKRRFRTIVLLVQKEVADRLSAKAGDDAYGSLSVFVGYHAVVETVGTVSKNVFLPKPQVDSAVVRITPVNPSTVEADPKRFFRVSRAAFGQRRKSMSTSLSCLTEAPPREDLMELLRAAGVDPSRRPETLSVQEFAAIANRWPAKEKEET